MLTSQQTTNSCPVNSYNEWDPLEEVIVGSLDGAIFPDAEIINQYTFPPDEWASMKEEFGGHGGVPYLEDDIEAGKKHLTEFIHILKAEGVTVRHPDIVNYATPFSSPDWQSSTGFSAANPRDPFMVVGNEIIEAPMADRSRYFEAWAYRSLFKEYFKAGAKLPQLIEISHRFERNQKSNFILSIIPSALCVGGVFILHTGIYFAYLVYYSGLFLGVGNATRPLLEANSTPRESD